MTQPSKAVAKALTDPNAWRRASDKLQLEALPHIYDAIRQVTDAPDQDARRAMLSRLPEHVRGITAAYVRAMWQATATFATDASPDGRREAMAWASEHGGDVHVVDGLNLTMVTVKITQSAK